MINNKNSWTKQFQILEVVCVMGAAIESGGGGFLCCMASDQKREDQIALDILNTPIGDDPTIMAKGLLPISNSQTQG